MTTTKNNTKSKDGMSDREKSMPFLTVSNIAENTEKIRDLLRSGWEIIDRQFQGDYPRETELFALSCSWDVYDKTRNLWENQ